MNDPTPPRRVAPGRWTRPGGPVGGMTAAALLAATLVGASCGDGVGPVGGEPIPPLRELDFGDVSPAVAYDLWELRRRMDGTPHEVIGAGGTASRDEIDPALLEEFDAASPSSGFGHGCLPGSCFFYFAGLDGTAIETADTVEEGVDFLGSIDSPEEAALVATIHGYYWGQERETGSVRRAGDGYELVVLRLVEVCAPVRTDRFRVRVSVSGRLSVLASEVWQRDENACI